MSPTKPPAVQAPVALAKVRYHLAGLRDYNPADEAVALLARAVQSVCVSIEHADATLSLFQQQCPTPREIKDAALNLRDRFLPKQPPLREQWEKQYGPPDSGWSRALIQSATAAVGDKKAQHKAERYNMRLQALKDSVYYSSPAGQAEINAIIGEKERNASRTFWAHAIFRNEQKYPVQIAAIRAGREPQFDEAKPEAVPMRPITAESFKGVQPMRIEKCPTCGGSGRLAGDDYCDDCQMGRDLRKMESSYSNGKDGAA
jgi:hypothetical protein